MPLRKFRLSRVAEETIELNVSSLKLSGIAGGRAARSREARGRDGAIRVRKLQQSPHHQPDAAHRVLVQWRGGYKISWVRPKFTRRCPHRRPQGHTRIDCTDHIAL